MCFVKIPEKCLGINRCWEVGRMMKVTNYCWRMRSLRKTDVIMNISNKENFVEKKKQTLYAIMI